MRTRDVTAGLMAMAAVTVAEGASAAPLGLDTTTPVLTVENAFVGFFEFDPDGNL